MRVATESAMFLFEKLCETTDSPFSLGLWLCAKYDHSSLANVVFPVKNYTDPQKFSEDYMCYAALRKYRGLNTGIDLKESALLSFRLAEDKCELMNNHLWSGHSTGRVDRLDSAILARCQELMAQIWGDPTPADIFSRCGWGPGATSSLKGGMSSREDKMSQFPVSITKAAVPYFNYVFGSDILWARHVIGDEVVGPVSLFGPSISFSDGCRVLTVFKDARSDRTIGAEPTGDIYLQKGVGGYLRSRLRRYGVNLDDQGLNQILASHAYLRDLATLDLKNASDSISIGVVRLLCPPSMFNLLNRLRSANYQLAGQWSRFHKFSSMGNGFTFELESLIFFCVCKAVEELEGDGDPVGVYGDDLIVSRKIAPRVIESLDALGFAVNKEKSFVDGLFFESCGKHYFMGIDVTPFYQKEVVTGELEYIRMTNRLFDWIQRDEFEVLNRRSRYGKVHALLLKHRPGVTRKVDLFGPAGALGDGFFRVFNARNVFDSGRGFKVKYLSPRPPKKRLADGGLYADSMRLSSRRMPNQQPGEPTLGFVDLRPRAKVTEFRVSSRWIPISAMK